MRSYQAIVLGQRWAQSVIAQMFFCNDPWPPYAGKAAAIARRKVAELSSDPRLIERFAKLCHEHAAGSWARRPWADLNIEIY